jgi:hypothetical protein
MELANREISPVHMKVSCYYQPCIKGRQCFIIVQFLDIQLEDNTTAGSWLILKGNRLMREDNFLLHYKYSNY